MHTIDLKIHPYIIRSVKMFLKYTTDTCNNVDESWKHYSKWKKSITKEHIQYDSTDMKCPE